MYILLHLLILFPIGAAIAILFGAPARLTALLVGRVNLALGFVLFAAFCVGKQDEPFRFASSFTVIDGWNLNYSLGLDGLSLIMVLLTCIVTAVALWMAPKVQKLEPLYYACLLFVSAGALGAFASRDLFFFYAFHELALIPTFLMIGIWGSGERQAIAWKITIYLAVGSFILLIGLLGVYYLAPAGRRTFDIADLQYMAAHGQLATAHANAIYLFLLVGFGILVSLFPFHTWAPQAYASAPTPLAMLHSGVLKKFGLYGLLRVALPILPGPAAHWANLLLVLLCGNIIYVGIIAIGQKRLDMTLGYSSVMHMGYIFLGIASLNTIGMSGAALLMFAHGLSIAALFALAGQVRQQTGTLLYSELGGLAKVAPFLGLVFGFATFASIGLPGFANFASEIMVFFGAFNFKATPAATFTFDSYKIAVILALWGVVISAVYMLRAYRAVFMGDVDKRWSGFQDIVPHLRWPVILLLATLMIAGFFPQFFLQFLTPVFLR